MGGGGSAAFGGASPDVICNALSRIDRAGTIAAGRAERACFGARIGQRNCFLAARGTREREQELRNRSGAAGGLAHGRDIKSARDFATSRTKRREIDRGTFSRSGGRRS